MAPVGAFAILVGLVYRGFRGKIFKFFVKTLLPPKTSEELSFSRYWHLSDLSIVTRLKKLWNFLQIFL